MNETSTPRQDQNGDLANIWSDSFCRLMQTAMTHGPEPPPPEMLRQIRSGFMQALSKSWEQYLRSPQFLEGMKHTMDQAVAFQKFSADFLTKTRHATEGVAHEDVESLRVVLVQMECRLSRQMDALSAQTNQLVKDLQSVKNASAQPPSVKEPAVRRKGKNAIKE